jgi:hypothetical protein
MFYFFEGYGYRRLISSCMAITAGAWWKQAPLAIPILRPQAADKNLLTARFCRIRSKVIDERIAIGSEVARFNATKSWMMLHLQLHSGGRTASTYHCCLSCQTCLSSHSLYSRRKTISLKRLRQWLTVAGNGRRLHLLFLPGAFSRPTQSR